MGPARLAGASPGHRGGSPKRGAMKLKILFHDNCFDGAASAAVFAAFFRSQQGGVDVRYGGVQHKQGDAFPPDALDGDVNACVDFRYSPSPRLDWWFDHH